MIVNYLKYLNMLDDKLKQFFLNQKSYIFCKKGCAKCCKNAQYPFSEIEFQYLLTGYFALPNEIKQQICLNIKQIIAEKNQKNENNFTYECPFLLNNTCTVYKYRGIMCRTFGLLNAVEGIGSEVPFCALDGLNYSNVYDRKNQKISRKMFEQLNIKEEPIAYNIKYKFLTSQEFGNGYGFKFGQVKPLIQWLEESKIFKNDLNTKRIVTVDKN